MLSHYRLVEKIGEGGMGVVWKGEDTVLNRTVAIKVLPTDVALDAERRRMFLEEARLAASVSHARIVQVYELGREGDLDFIVMEYVEGAPLHKLLRGKPLPLDKVAGWGLQVAEGLARAHRKGLIHRDLKPANILVTPDNEVKIVDFGLAALFERPDPTVSVESKLTESMSEETRTRIAGTLPYMSPEQVRGEKLDARSDIFSFGTVLYEMTTGQRPFQGPRPSDVVQAIQRSQPRPVHEVVPAAPLLLRQVLEKTLARRPEERFQIIDDVAVDLRRLCREIESAASPSDSNLEHGVDPAPRTRLRVLGGALAVLAIAFGIWFARGRTGGNADGNGPARSAAPARPNWILVAEFEGPKEDSTLVVAVRELVIAALGQSKIVVPITNAQLSRGLELALKPPGTRVAGEVARELAYRAGARSYVEGRVDRLQAARTIVLQVTDSERRNPMFTVSGVADNEDACIVEVDRLCRELRKKLGERRRSVQETLDSREAITPSFAAYQLYVQSGSMQLQQNFVSSNKVLDRALAHDPEFASAWSSKAGNFINLGLPDSARIALEKAIALPSRLTDEGRFRVEALRALMRNDPFEAVHYAELAGPRFLNNQAVILGNLGRYDDALECFYQAGEFYSPFGPTPLVVSNQIETLINLGRIAEARDLAKTYRGDRPQLLLSLATRQWSNAESLATDWASSANPDVRCSARMTLASMYVLRGEVQAGTQALVGIIPTHRRDFAARACFMLEYVRMLRRNSGAIACPPACRDTTAGGRMRGGIEAAALGNIAGAKKTLRELRDRPVSGLASVDLDFLEALIVAQEEDWKAVIHLLEPVRTGGLEPEVGRLPVRWLVAEAHENLGNLAEAAEAYELVVTPVRLCIWYEMEIQHQYALFLPFAYQRLVRLYATLGRLEKARHHWQMFQDVFTNPDPELLPLVEEARQALAGAEAKP